MKKIVLILLFLCFVLPMTVAFAADTTDDNDALGAVQHTVGFRVIDGNYSIGYSQQVEHGESIDWAAVESEYPFFNDKEWADIDLWCDDATGNPIALDMPITEDFVLFPLFKEAAVYHTVGFRVFDGDYSIGYSQQVEHGESIDWAAVESKYPFFNGEEWADIGSWCDDATSNPIALDMPITEDLVLFPRFSEAAKGNLGAVILITGSEIEIEYGTPILSDADAHDTFIIKVNGVEVEWEFLSYFDFGDYGDRSGVVNVRLKEPLDAGKPRVQRRAVVLFADTQITLGPDAAAGITVETDSTPVTAKWVPFYGEVQLGHMSQIEAWGATDAGNGVNNFTGAIGKPVYDTDYVTKQLGEGVNGMVGRAEYLNIPAVDAGLRAIVVGSSQSVYEVPEYREMYIHGTTDDTYTLTRINGTVDKPIIVTTADEVMRHDSSIDADGALTSDSFADPARPRRDYFDFGEDFLRLYYQFGVLQGSPLFPIGQFNDWDEYRYDVHLQRAYDKAMSEGKWAGTIMADSVENYYIYGAMIHFELIPESAAGSWDYERFPVNTREELHDYDNDLYRALCGIHGRYHWFTGTPEQDVSGAASWRDDTMKNRHPWFWRSQTDNYVVGSNGQPATRTPLAIEHVRIISDRQIEVKFNREIETITSAATAGNWKVYKDGTEITGVTMLGGYAWRTITLQVPSGTANRLDNGMPYGRSFSGFTQADIDERGADAGGWLTAAQSVVGANALEYGQLVTLEDAIRDWGAGASGVWEVEYVGTADVEDWAGNTLAKSVKHEADFLPYIGNAYRSPLTGFYVYADTDVVPDTIKAGAHMYDTALSNNQTITYDKTAGGEDFPADPSAVVASGTTPHNSSSRNYVTSMVSANFGSTPVTYDRVGQRIADGSVIAGGGMQIIAGSLFGHHAAMQPTHRNQITSGFHVWLYVEGWGGTTFQCDEVLILKDTQLSRYKNENLIFHEGGHGIDSYTTAGRPADFVRYDNTAAWVTSVATENGRRWWNQYNNEGAYLRNRDEFVSTGSTFWHGAMRESFLGINDGTWTPVNTREELYRYDPYAFEVFKRTYFNGELGLWYTNAAGVPQVGNPEYKVIPEDWALLKAQYPAEFGHWESENDLIAWAATIPETARDNPYTEEHNSSVNWISWNTPNVWDITLMDNPAIPENQFDFEGGVAYNPANPSPTESQEHPFFRVGGVKKPVRTAAIEALVTPVAGSIIDGSVTTPRPSLIQFEFVSYDGEITSNNVQASFELKVDGQQTHFYLWEFKESEPGVATVTLRLEWPLDAGTVVEVGLIHEQDTFTVSFEANGGEGSMTSDTVSNGSPYIIKDNTFTRSGYTFTGWNTAANGSGTAYAAGVTIPGVTSNITLYAQWSGGSTGDATAGINAPVEIFISQGNPAADRSLDYTINLANVDKLKNVKISAKFDLNHLDYVGYDINLPSSTYPVTAITTQPYDAATGQFNLEFFIAAQTLTYSITDVESIVTIHFTVKDGVPMDTEIEGNLNAVQLIVIDATNFSDFLYPVVDKDTAITKLSESNMKYNTNGDEKFDELDITNIINWYYLSSEGDDKWAAAKKYDVNSDGFIDLVDIVLLYSLL